MTCREATRRFGALLDGRLDAAARERLDSHLAGCAACRAALARWEAAARALRSLGPTPAPTGLAARAFRAAVAPRPAPAPWFAPAARRAALAGALAAAAIWIGLLAERGGTPAAAPEDPIEVAVQLWMTEGPSHGE
jgi:anti-sigma factor RsiW